MFPIQILIPYNRVMLDWAKTYGGIVRFRLAMKVSVGVSKSRNITSHESIAVDQRMHAT